MESVKTYSFKERLKYTKSRHWYTKRKILWFWIPIVPNNLSIHIDYIWRDINIKHIKNDRLQSRK